jgi:hypothetical protein
VLLAKLAELGAHLVEGAVPVAGVVLQLLPSVDETRKCHTTKTSTKTARSKEKSNSILPGKHAAPGRRESAAPRSAPG